ncbi:hypothetical protein FRC11_006209 [Ceratobasidium sp. 423]|nr:hypothetical protein FRC11_006209 [Ceratobasidium sp. 423]
MIHSTLPKVGRVEASRATLYILANLQHPHCPVQQGFVELSACFGRTASQYLSSQGPSSTSDRRQQLPINEDDINNALKALDEPDRDPLDVLRKVHQALEDIVLTPKEVPANLREKMDEYLSCRIGTGFVRFVGLEDAAVYIDISRDLDSCVNPRDRSDDHIQKIAASIREKKMDWKYPIIIRVAPQLLDPPVRESLGKVQPFQEFSSPGPFRLNNESPREKELTAEIYWERSLAPPYVYFTPAQLEEKRVERDNLRQARPRATLVNGGHRIESMGKVSEDFTPVRRRMLEAERKYFENPDDPELKEAFRLVTREFVAGMNQHTWQVLVFKDDTPDWLLNELATNSEPLPTLPAGPVEQMWMHAEGIKAELAAIQLASPNLPRPDLMDAWWERRCAKNEVTPVMGKDDEESRTPEVEAVMLKAAARTKGKGRATVKDGDSAQTSKQKGGGEGAAMYQRLTQDPLLLEFLLANHSCTWVMTSMLSASSVTTLLHPGSGGAVAFLWMACELLQRIANTSGDEAFAAARAFNASTPKLRARGYQEAIKPWQNLHRNPQRLPEALKEYGPDLAKKFEAIYGERFGTDKNSDNEFLCREWDTEDTAIGTRVAFEKWGIQLEKDSNPHVVRMGTSARLYARLVSFELNVSLRKKLISDGHASHKDFFFNRAILPTNLISFQWIRLSRALMGPGSGAGMEFLEYLFDRNKPMWALASGDTTRPRKNWYNSTRGTLHAVMQFMPEHSMGCVIVRMSSIADWLFHPDFYQAVRFVDKAVDPKHRINDMRLTYGAGKKRGLSTLTEDTLAQFAHRFPLTGLPDAAAVLEALKNVAGTALRAYIKEGNPDNLPGVIEANPCLKVISDLYWRSVQIIWWSSAFQSTYIAHCVIGWGLLMDMYELHVVENLLLHRRVYHLCNLAGICYEGDPGPWWGDSFELPTLRRIRRQVLNSSKELVPSDDESDSDPDDVDFQCKSVNVITNSRDGHDHITSPRLKQKSAPATDSGGASKAASAPKKNNKGKKRGRKSTHPAASSNDSARKPGPGTTSRPVPRVSKVTTAVSSADPPTPNAFASPPPPAPPVLPPLPPPPPPPPPPTSPAGESPPHGASTSASFNPKTPTRLSNVIPPEPRCSTTPGPEEEVPPTPTPPGRTRSRVVKTVQSHLQGTHGSPSKRSPAGRDISPPPAGTEFSQAHNPTPLPDRGNTPVPLNRDFSPPAADPSTVAANRASSTQPISTKVTKTNTSLVFVGDTQSSVPDTELPGVMFVWCRSLGKQMDFNWVLVPETDDLRNPDKWDRQAAPKVNLNQYQNQIRESLVIPGVIINGFLSNRLLPGYEGQLFFRRFRNEERMLKEINDALELTKNALHVAFEARRNFQSGILQDLQRAVSHSNPTSYILANLAPNLYHLKLSYIQELAVSFSILGIPLDDALAEAAFMAANDKVLASELFEWKENGDLVGDFSVTFPRAMSASKDGTKLIVANVKRQNAVAFWKLAKITATAISQGASQASAMIRATKAGPIQAFQVHTFNQDATTKYSAEAHTAQEPTIQDLAFDQAVAFDAIAYESPTEKKMSTYDLVEDLGMSLNSYEDGPRTYQEPISCFSGGNFIRPTPWFGYIPDDLQDVNSEIGIPRPMDALLDAGAQLVELRTQLECQHEEEWKRFVEGHPELKHACEMTSLPPSSPPPATSQIAPPASSATEPAGSAAGSFQASSIASRRTKRKATTSGGSDKPGKRHASIRQ